MPACTPNVVYDVLIVGAGPAGLTAAACLARDGHQVTVLESRSELRTIGGPVQIQAGAQVVVRAAGYLDELSKTRLPAGTEYYWSREQPDSPLFGRRGGLGEGDVHLIASTRHNVQRLAYEAAVQAGVQVLFNKKVVQLEDAAQKPLVKTSDGSEYTADFIVAADGVKSRMRDLMFPENNVKAVPKQSITFCAKVSMEKFKFDSRSSPWTTRPGLHWMFGSGTFNICPIYPGAQGFPQAYFDVTTYDEFQPEEESWYTTGGKDDLLSRNEKALPMERAYLEATVDLERWHHGEAPQLASWRSPKGKVVLLGDAAHAMLPYMGQGLSQGIESAGALAHILRRARMESRNDDLAELLAQFEAIRKPRAERFVQLSKKTEAIVSLPPGPAQKARDAIYRAKEDTSTPDWDSVEADMQADIGSPALNKWITSYNVFDEVSISVLCRWIFSLTMNPG